MPTTTGKASEFITFSRTSNATVTDSDGKIKWAPHNLLLASEQFDASIYSKTNITVTANATAAPNGTSTADKVEATATAGTVMFQAAVIGGPCTYSIWVKKGNIANRFNTYLVRNSTTATNLLGFTVNYDTGALVYDIGSSGALVENAGSGWWKITMTVTSGVSSSDVMLFYTGAAGATYTAGDHIFVWGAHVYRSDLGGMKANTSAYPMYNPTTPKNLLGQTEAFDVSPWSNSNAGTGGTPVVTANSGLAPNGLMTADRIQFSLGGGTSTADITRRIQVYNTISATPYTFSFYAKSFDGAPYTLHINSAAGLTVSTVTVTGEWQRFSATANGFGGNTNIGFGLRGGQTPTNSNTADILVWGAQLSDSASLDAYVPNNGAAPTAAAYYGPRLDYDPVTLAAKGLLVEEQRNNRVQQTEDFTVSPWLAAVSGTSTIVNGTNARGFRTATVTATSALGGIRQALLSLTSGQVYTLSFYIQSTATSLPIVFENGTSSFGAPHSVTINPSNGTAGSPVGFTSVTSTPLGSGYIYQLVTLAAGGSLFVNLEVRLSNSGDSFQIGRPQFENGSFATSYIPTGAATATRNADVASVSTNQFPYSSAAGSVVVSMAYIPSQTGHAFSLDDATTTNRVYAAGLSANTFNGLVTASGSTDFNQSMGTLTGNTPFKGAIAYALNSANIAVNGSSGTDDPSVALPSAATRLVLGNNAVNAAPLSGWIRQITYIPRRLTNAELQTRTSA